MTKHVYHYLCYTVQCVEIEQNRWHVYIDRDGKNEYHKSVNREIGSMQLKKFLFSYVEKRREQ